MNFRILYALSALSALSALPSPAIAAAVVSPCDKTLTAPDGAECAGYYSGNLLGGSASKIADQKAAIASLSGDYTFDGNWGVVDATKVETLTNGNRIDFGTSLYGITIVGAHFGNIAGDAGNVTVFWRFDFGSTGAQYVSLDNTQGFSNSVLYTTGSPAVPEPTTWLLLILGFAGIGFSLRNRDKSPGAELLPT